MTIRVEDLEGDAYVQRGGVIKSFKLLVHRGKLIMILLIIRADVCLR